MRHISTITFLLFLNGFLAYLGHIFPRLTTPFTHSNGVVINTNNAETALSINGYVDPLDSTVGDVIHHYGEAGSLEIIKCANGSYHEFGNIAFAEISEGRMVLEDDSEIKHIHINANATSDGFKDVTIADKGAAALPAAITRDEVTVADETLVVTVESVEGDVEEVYVYPNGAIGTTEKTVDQNAHVETDLGELVLDNGSEAGEKALDEDTKEAAKETAVEEAIIDDNQGYVARIGATKYATLQEAVNAVDVDLSSPTTVVLLVDHTIAGTLNNINILGSRNIILDLNGKVLNFDNSIGGFKVDGKALYGNIVVDKTAILNIVDGMITSNGFDGTSHQLIGNAGTLTIGSNAVLEMNQSQSSRGMDVIRNKAEATLHVYGTIKGTYFTGNAVINNEGTATIYAGAEVLNVGGDCKKTIQMNSNTSQLTVEGGLLTAGPSSATPAAGIISCVYDAAEVEIRGGTFEKNLTGIHSTFFSQSTGHFTISGGTFNDDPTALDPNRTQAQFDAHITINGNVEYDALTAKWTIVPNN